MPDYEHSETRSPLWRLIKTNSKLQKPLHQVMPDYEHSEKTISILEADQNHTKIITKTTSSDAR